MEITGRVTKDAAVRKVKGGREVVSFSVAINDRYKTKSGEQKEETTYFQCSYWLSTKVAGQLTKGSIVHLMGRVGINAYKDMGGDYHATLTFHCNAIKVIARGGKNETKEVLQSVDLKDDLPF
ncbi:MAG: single-stranded DNA-binding protein [Taibaiella sp.]|nr:single-stranded DNA-binding protein [Taibaiella sp.]